MPEYENFSRNIENDIPEELKKLIENKNWKVLKEIISGWYPSDIADLLDEIDLEDAIMIFRLLPPDMQSEVFSELDSEMQEKMLINLTNKHIKAMINELNPDDRTELFEEMPSDLTRKLINFLSQKKRKEALQLLGYPDNSVGRLMTPEYVAIKANWSIKRAMKHLREVGKDAETIDMIYVVDDEWYLLDDIPIRRLLLADPKDTVESIMDGHFVSITATSDQEEAIKLFEKYNLVALPVTDNERHLLGIVTVDDIIDTLREEQTEDFTRFSAIEAESVGLDFITNIKDVPVSKLFRARITWLITLLFMDLVTGGIIQSFEAMIAKYVVLITFLPVLVDTAGNAGSQSATLVIRALALGTVKMRDWFYLFGKELLVGGLLGLVMGAGISIMGFVRSKNFLIAKVVVVAMILNVLVGSLIGVLLPFIFTKLKKDPATASTPLITTLADILGTGIFLSIAYFMLG